MVSLLYEIIETIFDYLPKKKKKKTFSSIEFHKKKKNNNILKETKILRIPLEMFSEYLIDIISMQAFTKDYLH